MRIVRRRFWPFGNTRRVIADANGYFGAGKVEPGHYEVALEKPGRSRLRFEARVESGKVVRVNPR